MLLLVAVHCPCDFDRVIRALGVVGDIAGCFRMRPSVGDGKREVIDVKHGGGGSDGDAAVESEGPFVVLEHVDGFGSGWRGGRRFFRIARNDEKREGDEQGVADHGDSRESASWQSV